MRKSAGLHLRRRLRLSHDRGPPQSGLFLSPGPVTTMPPTEYDSFPPPELIDTSHLPLSISIRWMFPIIILSAVLVNTQEMYSPHSLCVGCGRPLSIQSANPRLRSVIDDNHEYRPNKSRCISGFLRSSRYGKPMSFSGGVPSRMLPSVKPFRPVQLAARTRFSTTYIGGASSPWSRMILLFAERAAALAPAPMTNKGSGVIL